MPILLHAGRLVAPALTFFGSSPLVHNQWHSEGKLRKQCDTVECHDVKQPGHAGALISFTQFRELDVRTNQAVERIESRDQDIEMLRLLLLARADPDKYFAEMVTTLKRWCAANPSVHVASRAGGTIVIASGQMLSHPKTSSQLSSLETLARVETPYVRQSSMSGIRSLHSPDSIPFLIKQLDFPDDTYTQYLALISLVEITGRGGEDFGPAMNLFERDPQRYIQTWKRWWSAQVPAGVAIEDHSARR